MKINILATLLLIAIVFQSCQSNEIYVDIDKQEIRSSNRKGINLLYIKGVDTAEYYKVVWSDSDHKAPVKLILNPLTKGFIITGGWMDTTVTSQTFKLGKNKTYIIETGEGDASKYSIKVSINNDGNIFKQSH